jgi:VIT1/CCC1 family predicted Fe2+/Mn2+ transporter
VTGLPSGKLPRMSHTTLGELVPLLQVAIGPVILISGIGLLLLSLTNRFGRAVDRSRQLLSDMRAAGEHDRRHLRGQVEVLYRRARLIQVSIILGASSVLCAALLVITLFFAALFHWEHTLLVSLLFVGCLLMLLASLLTFIFEIHLSLKALRLEMGEERQRTAT